MHARGTTDAPWLHRWPGGRGWSRLRAGWGPLPPPPCAPPQAHAPGQPLQAPKTTRQAVKRVQASQASQKGASPIPVDRWAARVGPRSAAQRAPPGRPRASPARLHPGTPPPWRDGWGRAPARRRPRAARGSRRRGARCRPGGGSNSGGGRGARRSRSHPVPSPVSPQQGNPSAPARSSQSFLLALQPRQHLPRPHAAHLPLPVLRIRAQPLALARRRHGACGRRPHGPPVRAPRRRRARHVVQGRIQPSHQVEPQRAVPVRQLFLRVTGVGLRHV